MATSMEDQHAEGSDTLSSDNCLGWVFFVNHIEGCKGDVDKLSKRFESLDYKCVILKSDTDNFVDKLEKYKPCINGQLVVFFFGYGYKDYLFFDQSCSVSVSYEVFCEKVNSVRKVEGSPTIVFTNICFKEKQDHTNALPSSLSHLLRETFHISVKINGNNESGSLMTKAILKETESNRNQSGTFSTFATNIVCRIKELKKKGEVDMYFTCENYYGITKIIEFPPPKPTLDYGWNRSSQMSWLQCSAIFFALFLYSVLTLLLGSMIPTSLVLGIYLASLFKRKIFATTESAETETYKQTIIGIQAGKGTTEDILSVCLQKRGIGDLCLKYLKKKGILTIEELQGHLRKQVFLEVIREISTDQEYVEFDKLRGEDQTSDTKDDGLDSPNQDTTREKEKSKGNVSSDPTKEQKELLDALGLTDYFPEKMSLKDVQERSSLKLESLSDIPWYFLAKTLMLDYRGRDDVASLLILNNSSVISESDTDEEFQSDDEILLPGLDDCFHSDNTYQSVPHPMDVVVAVLWCCSNFLRQIVCEKMFICKLGIPLILPAFLDQPCKFLRYALMDIELECMKNDKTLCEGSVVNLPIPFVSCLRFGKTSQSKSKFLNEILNEQKHPTFYHKDREGGIKKRVLSEGIPEIAWSLRSRNWEDFESTGKNEQSQMQYLQNSDIAILNFRGDANTHQDMVKVVSRLSDVVLAIVDISEIKSKSIIENMKLISAHNIRLFIILTRQQRSNVTREMKQNIKDFGKKMKGNGFSKRHFITGFSSSGDKNIKELIKETKEKVSTYLGEKFDNSDAETLEDRSELLSLCVDDHVSECSSAKIKASREMIKNTTDFCRRAILPLQCEPWEELSSLKKKEQRRKNIGNENLSTYMDKLSIKKTKQRRKQLELVEKPTELFSQFLHNLLEFNDAERLYYLRWLKLNLSNKSNDILPGLRYDLSEKWNAIHESEDNKEGNLSCDLNGISNKEIESNLVQLRKEYSEIERTLADSSIGLEHFLRECSQFYEAFKEDNRGMSPKNKERILQLPKIMAELMLEGYPLEILDGDAGGVPLHWIKSVFEKLQEILGDKKIFVISVLGVQSSGKSTLLNAMFGLQLTVATGRCTRGIYAQLIPIPIEHLDGNYEYLLILDTEELRAAELGNEKLLHDNEMATFAVGMGDVTIINIKGENISEMEDVLQIIVHALLKMKLVNKDLKLQPECIIIHQNVSVPNAANKLGQGQQRIIETLDKVTCAAGKEEDAPHYTKFSHIIDFDMNTSFFYFSDLWRGDPPMAPTNPGYSDNVNKVKLFLLNVVKNNRFSDLTIEKFGVKIENLWKGILNENFVFSFKNSIEIEAYSHLELVLSRIIRSLKKAAIEWRNDKEKEIKGSAEDKTRDDFEAECKTHLKGHLEISRKKLEELFEEKENQSVLVQWEARSLSMLEGYYNDIIQESVRSLSTKVVLYNIQRSQKKKIEKHETEIVKIATEEANKLKNNDSQSKLDVEALEKLFKDMWTDLFEKLQKHNIGPIDIETIETKVKYILHSKFPTDNALVEKIIDSPELLTKDEIQEAFETALDYFFSEHNKVKEIAKRLLWKKETANKEAFIKKFVYDAFEIIDAVQKSEIFSLTKVTRGLYDQIQSSGLRISINSELENCIAIFVSIYASYLFSGRYRENLESIGKCQLKDFGICPSLELLLLKEYHHVNHVIHNILVGKLNISMFSVDRIAIRKKGTSVKDARKAVDYFQRDVTKKVKLIIEKSNAQEFRKEHVEEILDLFEEMMSNLKVIAFKKEKKISMALYLCYGVIPKLIQKHKNYLNNLDPRIVFAMDDTYGRYLTLFKDTYKGSTGELELSKVFSEYLTKAIEKTVDNEIAADLADDVRNNVPELKLKMSLSRAILNKLLDIDHYKEFRLYLKNIDKCYDKAILYFTKRYLFGDGSVGKNRYFEIASRKICNLKSTICDNISDSIKEEYQYKGDKTALHDWIRNLQDRIKNQIGITEQELLSLTKGYQIHDIGSFINKVKDHLDESENGLLLKFQEHGHDHLTSHEENVYELVSREVKGCTEVCPFCSAPCIMFIVGHAANGVAKHRAKEHYPQGCKGITDLDSRKLATQNCTLNVAGNGTFRNGKTNWESHPWKKYQEIYPDWQIDGDPSIDASPYWKWFLVKYEKQLVERYNVERPDIPDSWKDISKEIARNSVN